MLHATNLGPLSIDPALVEARINALGQIGRNESTGGLHRYVYTPAWSAAKALVAGWMNDLGMTVRDDAVGNLVGRIEGTQPLQAVLTGSHIDTVIDGGRFDGGLGVIASITAIEALMRAYGIPKRPLEILVTCDEEGGRFHTNFWGSRAVAGEITVSDTTAHVDADGISLETAMRQAGYDPVSIADARRGDVAAWIELHIEQGRILEESGTALGMVTAIAGHGLWDVTLTGREDHAGTAPMDLRRDALLGAAEIINRALTATRAAGPPAVLTVGRLGARPGIANVVPRSVRFTLDIRDEKAERFHDLLACVDSIVRDGAAARSLEIDVKKLVHREPTPMDDRLIELLTRNAGLAGRTYRTMPSMAGHDSEVMAHRCPSAMLFVPSGEGRSHTPAEFTPIEQIVPGVELLASVLHALAYDDAWLEDRRNHVSRPPGDHP
jgi:allantoate deiminase